ncbi:MAG TPA: hypothetical protein VL738_21550, partial [Dactylosporangium sp.]|nr:hypothetical protein [Dactylosporangium sp.]
SAYTIEATTAGNTVTAVDPATGRPRWTRTLPGHGSAEVARGVTALQATTPASLPVVTTESARSRITFLATATGAVIATRDTQDPRGIQLVAPGIVLAHDPAERNCPVFLPPCAHIGRPARRAAAGPSRSVERGSRQISAFDHAAARRRTDA